MSKLVDDAVCDYFSSLLNDTPIAQRVETDESTAINHGTLSVEPRQQHGGIAVQAKEFATAEVEDRISQLALAQLLAPVSAPKVIPEPIVEPKPAVTVVAEKQIAAVSQKSVLPEEMTLNAVAESINIDDANVAALQAASTPASMTKELIEQLDDEFQVLFFKVAGLTLAVPLVSLGGIVNLERINHLMGRPSWYLGVQQHRQSQLNVVDTCAWVMPEKYDQSLAEKVSYKYIVLLQDSSWGLTCESLVNTVKIHKSQVNWRSQAGKRPWLAGVVKEQMCGILNVYALITMLDSGLGSQG
ncbi:chemotaxis protein CheW [Shewanella sp. KX20019]|uniref:chemotaxis protein CheW n=1 Tax=Shewanella sp. KX20019 TaxID=2803864 RepID=UPI0019271CC4|nr:chemotaxis protein CheW [Shewanella sp. KX20019]QQX81786.1 chemotaxis protein CheW [Shewanella sp. KX20019]